MNRDDSIFRRRMLDLANAADKRGVCTFSDFLDLNEQSVLHSMSRELSFVDCRLYGGYETAERQMAAFLPDAFVFSGNYPMKTICIRPKNSRFSESFTHRDVLGSIMNLGLERSRFGDIVMRESDVIMFCHEKNADYVCESLSRIRHTDVEAFITGEDAGAIEPKTKEIAASAASVRLDVICALAFHLSRSAAASLVSAEKVYINGRIIQSNSAHPSPGDIISVRGYGKFRYEGETGTTRKGRCMVRLSLFI